MILQTPASWYLVQVEPVSENMIIFFIVITIVYLSDDVTGMQSKGTIFMIHVHEAQGQTNMQEHAVKL